MHLLNLRLAQLVLVVGLTLGVASMAWAGPDRSPISASAQPQVLAEALARGVATLGRGMEAKIRSWLGLVWQEGPTYTIAGDKYYVIFHEAHKNRPLQPSHKRLDALLLLIDRKNQLVEKQFHDEDTSYDSMYTTVNGQLQGYIDLLTKKNGGNAAGNVHTAHSESSCGGFSIGPHCKRLQTVMSVLDRTGTVHQQTLVKKGKSWKRLYEEMGEAVHSFVSQHGGWRDEL